MTIEVVKCPKCSSTNVIPDMEWDGRFGAIWCPSCKTEFWLSGPTRTRWIVIGLRALIVIGGLLFAYELFAK